MRYQRLWDGVSRQRRLMCMKRVLPCLILLLFAAAQSSLGCSVTPKVLRQASPDLTVVVNHRDRPISGIEVQVVSSAEGAEPVFTGLTDEGGTVQVKGLMEGRYILTASHGGFQAGEEWIEVVGNRSAKTIGRFVFQWADGSYQSRRLAGTLTGLVPGDTGNAIMDLAHAKHTIYPGVAITVRSAFSEEIYRTVSDDTGSFVIEPVPDGIYILTIAGGMKSISGVAGETSQVIDLTQAVTKDHLPLRLQDIGCYRIEFAMDEL